MTDHKYMWRALELAALGKGSVSPNPMVGCVIVYKDQIIGEGYHEAYGKAHAEVNAIQSVNDQNLLPYATLYVSLEPCSHHGKTPPCADLIISHRIPKVVIGAKDSNPLVGGTGIKKLKAAGIDVEEGVLEKEALRLNKRFFTYMDKQRPYVILKWAQTLDGFIARSNYDSKWISNLLSRQLVHRWRAEEDAIMVGTKTAEYDDPQLNVRDWTGKEPIRVVLDKHLNLNENLHLFDGTQHTICFNLLKTAKRENLEWIKMQKNFSVSDLLDELYKREIQSLIVEGGGLLLTSFIEAGLWDEARVFTGEVKFGLGIPAPVINKAPAYQQKVMDDNLQQFINHE